MGSFRFVQTFDLLFFFQCLSLQEKADPTFVFWRTKENYESANGDAYIKNARKDDKQYLGSFRIPNQYNQYNQWFPFSFVAPEPGAARVWNDK
jgi:hypothetical protein